ncbi:MAG: PTS sugar transporter subunit IIA [Alphaproteobacteria bacterium]|nr:PTS sugar transporter subunit IIA [Alphaproteobacteria bacterium]
MLNQSSFMHDTMIDIVLPTLPGETAGDVRASLLKSLVSRQRLYAAAFDIVLSDPALVDEALRSAAIGSGVGVTALKVPALKSAVSVLAKIKSPQALPASDGRGIDLLCVLLYPESESVHYLRRLSRLTRLFRNPDLCAKIRETDDADTIKSLIHNPEGWMLAA